MRKISLLILFVLVACAGNVKSLYAHGGVIIDGGFTDQYEWIAMASPFPITPGETVLSIVVYDVETYAPINGIAASMHLAPPDSPEPCCQGDGVLGPLPLLVDPVLYPGDYSNIVLLLREGKWKGKFAIEGPSDPVDIFFTVDVREQDASEPRPTPLQGDLIAQTATAVAQQVAEGLATSTAIPSTSASVTETGSVDIPLISPSGTVESSAYPDPADAAYPDPADAAYPDPGKNNSALTAVVPQQITITPAPATAMPTPLPDNGSSPETTNDSLAIPPWVTENIWLVAGVAFIPLLLVVLWFMGAGSGDDDEGEGDP
ncbi:MAG: hypothetical protein AAF702_22970 [Chloroflexota bacterium]